MKLSKLIFSGVAIVAVMLFGMTVVSVSATPDDHNTAPPCHGANEEKCRDDPQPDRGKDCEHSDDHVCVPTSTPTTPPNGGVTPVPTTVASTPTTVPLTPTATVPELKSPQNPTPTPVPPVVNVVPSSPPVTAPAPVVPARPVVPVVPQRLPASGSGGYLPQE